MDEPAEACRDVLGLGVVLRPYPFELIQVMRPQDGPVARQVVKVVHDDSHKQVDDLKGARTTKQNSEDYTARPFPIMVCQSRGDRRRQAVQLSGNCYRT